MAAIEYQKNKRTIVGLMNYEKLILRKLFIYIGTFEEPYQKVKEHIRRVYRMDNQSAIELIDVLSKLGYIERMDNLNPLKVRIVRDEWGEKYAKKNKK